MCVKLSITKRWPFRIQLQANQYHRRVSCLLRHYSFVTRNLLAFLLKLQYWLFAFQLWLLWAAWIHPTSFPLRLPLRVGSLTLDSSAQQLHLSVGLHRQIQRLLSPAAKIEKRHTYIPFLSIFGHLTFSGSLVRTPSRDPPTNNGSIPPQCVDMHVAPLLTPQQQRNKPIREPPQPSPSTRSVAGVNAVRELMGSTPVDATLPAAG